MCLHTLWCPGAQNLNHLAQHPSLRLAVWCREACALAIRSHAAAQVQHRRAYKGSCAHHGRADAFAARIAICARVKRLAAPIGGEHAGSSVEVVRLRPRPWGTHTRARTHTEGGGSRCKAPARAFGACTGSKGVGDHNGRRGWGFLTCGESIKLTASTRLEAHSPARAAPNAACEATRPEEHAVS